MSRPPSRALAIQQTRAGVFFNGALFSPGKTLDDNSAAQREPNFTLSKDIPLLYVYQRGNIDIDLCR